MGSVCMDTSQPFAISLKEHPHFPNKSFFATSNHQGFVVVKVGTGGQKTAPTKNF